MFNSKNLQFLYNNSSKFLNSFIVNTNNKNEILEPLCCLVRLAMLQFKEDGIKISISNNKITYNENYPFSLQGIFRWQKGDNRNDLHNLHNPIEKSTLWYDPNIKEIRQLILDSITGLQKLKKSYEHQSIIQHTLDHYINILKLSLDRPNSIKQEKKIRSQDMDMNGSLLKDNLGEFEIEENITTSYHIDKTENYQNNVIYDSLKKLWTYREIQIINAIFSEMKNKLDKDGEELNAYLYSLDKILLSKELNVSKIIQDTTTIL
jgi:hypothetical protein